MQTAGLADDVHAGPEEEVVRVAEQNLRADLIEFAQVECLNGGLRADRHEDRRVDRTALGGQPA